MATVYVTAQIDVPDDDADDGDRTGLTERAHSRLTDQLHAAGLDDVELHRDDPR